MTLLTITYTLNALLMITFGLGLGAFLTRRFDLSWRLYWIGGVTFILSQVGHIPFNAVVLPRLIALGMPEPPSSAGIICVAIFAGLSSGLWEEGSRWVMYRWPAKDARSWRQGLVLGAGHGGVEAILTGLLAGWGLFQLMALLGVSDLSTVVPVDRVPELQATLDAYWSAPWYATILGALERALVLPVHLSLSVLVLQCFTRQQGRWWMFAVLWHATLNGVVYAVMQFSGNAYLTELILAIFTMVSIAIIWRLRDGIVSQVDEPIPEAVPLPSIVIKPPSENDENLEDTKYG